MKNPATLWNALVRVVEFHLNPLMEEVSPPGNSTVSPRIQMDDSPAERKRTFSKVLLVDDSRYLADILAMFFKLDGYSSRAAYGGVEAIAAMEDEVPDIAFIDLDMPGMSGMDLARHIRASEASATILVALSGWEGEEYRKEAAAAGFDHFLTKPAAPPAIREFMQSLSGADACRDSF